MDIMIDNRVQGMTKEMDGKKGRREEIIALDRKWLLETEQEVKSFDTNMERRLLQNQGIMKGDKDTKGNGCTERERDEH